MHGRAVTGLTKKLALDEGVVVDDLTTTVGQSGAAHPLLVLASALESMAGGAVPAGTAIAVLHLADGADAVVMRTTEALAAGTPPGPWPAKWPTAHRSPMPSSCPGAANCTRATAAAGAGPGVEHGRPPQRGLEVRLRRIEDRSSGAVHLPPSRVSMEAGPSTTWSPSPWPTPPAPW